MAIQPISETQSIQQNPPFFSLSNDILIMEILRRLSFLDVCACSLTCKQLKTIASDDFLWKLLFQRDFPHSTSEVKEGHFKAAYQDDKRMHANLSKGIYASYTLNPKYDELEEVKCLLLHKDKLFLGHTDRMVTLWDYNKKTILRAFPQEKVINSLVFVNDDGLILATDGSIKKGHFVEDDLAIHWTAVSKACDVDFRSLAVRGNELFASDADGYIHVYNVKTNKFLGKIKAHKKSIYSLQFVGEKLIVSSLDGTITIWKSRPFVLQRTFTFDSDTFTTCLADKNGTLILAGVAHSQIEIWDLNKMELTRTIDLSTKVKGGFLSFALADGKLVVRTDDRAISIWDYETGECLHCQFSTTMATCTLHPELFRDGLLFIIPMHIDECDPEKDTSVIEIWDFKAQEYRILQQIAELFTFDEEYIAFHRFSLLPQGTKDSIYRELELMLTTYPPMTIDAGRHTKQFKANFSGEDAFHDDEQVLATNAQKAKAIKRHLKKKVKRES